VAVRDRLRHEKAALETRVFQLTERLRVAEQRRLGIVMLAVLPVMWGVAMSMDRLRHVAHLVAPACGALLGLVLGPRMLRAVRGETGQRVALGQVAADATVRNVGLLPMALAGLALGFPFFLLGTLVSHSPEFLRGTGGPFIGLQVELLLASFAVVAARRGEQLADAGRGTWRRLATAAGAVAFLPLLFVFLARAVGLSERWDFEAGPDVLARPLRQFLHHAEGLALMAPAALLLPWRLDGMLQLSRRRPWAWPIAALSGGVALLALVAALQSNAWPSPADAAWSPRGAQWVPPPWHAMALAGWCALGALLWASRARESRREREAEGR
jgi:hypothetical protein